MGLGQLLFGFNGRIRRTTYWLAGLGAGVVGFVIFIVLFFILGGGAAIAAYDVDPNSSAATVAGAGVGIGLGILFLVYWLFMIWISLALHIKRWHDRDKSGAMVLIVFIPVVGGIWSFIECGFMDGTMGPNQFGPSPKGVVAPPAPQPQ